MLRSESCANIKIVVHHILQAALAEYHRNVHAFFFRARVNKNINAGLIQLGFNINIGGGVAFQKYTGSRGKSGASDANPEFIAKVRNLMDNACVKYQMAELGKVDQGGGGTIAYHAAKYGMNVLDAGIAVLSMHAPWEITSKEDLSQLYECYKSFLDIV